MAIIIANGKFRGKADCISYRKNSVCFFGMHGCIPYGGVGFSSEGVTKRTHKTAGDGSIRLEEEKADVCSTCLRRRGDRAQRGGWFLIKIVPQVRPLSQGFTCGEILV